MRKYIYHIILLILLFSKLSVSQDTFDTIDAIYGPDALLHNGKLYNTVSQNNIKGHQFLKYKDFTKGVVIIKGLKYDCNQINYDIYNQKLLLKYSFNNGAERIIALSDAWLEKFFIFNSEFKINPIDKIIYQVIKKDSIEIHYHWYKLLSLKYKSGKSNYYYSKSKKKSFISIKGKKYKYKNNRSFISIFESNKQHLIKKYLRQNKIKVKDATDKDMLSLIKFCSNLKYNEE